jgi:hypothetical protein
VPRPKVFVSYSHLNEEALTQLLRFLRPLEREGLLAAWADTTLQGGDDWEQKIDEALAEATVGVMLISQDFLDSSFIIQKEVPRLLEREAAGHLRMIPVFLSPSLVDQIGFADPRRGGREKLLLTKFQGYGTPDQPLSSLGWSDKERIYSNLVRQIQSLTGTDLPSGAPVVASPVPGASTTAPAGPARVFELTVQLEDRGDTLVAIHHLPGREPLGSAPPLVWAEVQKRIEPIHETLNRVNNLALLPYLGSRDGWGDTLFDLLFGPLDYHEKVFRTLFGRPAGPRPYPALMGVRLRIHTEDSRLSGLPWRLTSWKGQPLLDSGWSFTTTQVLDPVADLVTTAPANVLVVAPQTGGSGGGPHQPEHARAVLDALAKAWPTGGDAGYVQVARTRGELEQGLRSLRPTILYIYAHGTVDGGRPSLLLEGARGAEPLPLAELRRLLSAPGQTPAVVYLNAEGLNPRTGASTPDQIFGDLVPLLLWRRRPEWTPDSTTVAVQWLLRWLEKGEDPVAAFHQIHSDSGRTSCEACTLALHSGYRTWKTTLFQAGPRKHYPLLRLDRDHQKSMVRKHLEELVRSGTRRVMALVPYAAPGHSLPSLWEQLRHDLDLSLSHLAEIRWLRLQLPAVRAGFRRDLEEELRLQLNAGPNEMVRSLLHRHAPRAVGPGRKPVLWLAWDGDAAPRLAEEPLADWLRFSSEFLVAHCPDDLRLVSYLPQEVPFEEHDSLLLQLQEQRRRHRLPAFRLSELPPLGKVGESDLLNFLEEPDNSSCDANIQPEVAERIIRKTGGVFEATVALLEEAEAGSWYDLLAILRAEQETAS